MTRIKPLTIVATNKAEAKRLADEYEYIGIATRVTGRFLTVLLHTIKPKKKEVRRDY